MTLRGGLLVAICLALVGCATERKPTPRAQRVIDVLCRGDLRVQPVVVPVIIQAAPLAGSAAPVIIGVATMDQLLIHPAVVRACAKWMSEPIGVVVSPEPGAMIVEPVMIEEDG